MDNKADVEKILEFIENYSTQGQEAPITTKSSSSVKDATTTTGVSLASIVLAFIAFQGPLADVFFKLNEEVFESMIEERLEEHLRDMDVKEEFKKVYEALDKLEDMSKEDSWKLREKISELESKVERELYWAKLQKLSEGNTAP